MKYTLITSLGTGLYKKGSYDSTNYSFPNGTNCKSQFFLDAIMKSGYKEISKIILVGTKTSSWDILIDSMNSDNEDLWFNVKSECEDSNVGLSEDNKIRIQELVSKKYGIPVVLKVHSAVLDENTSRDVFNVYNSISKEILKDTKVLFDITHGFRSMPILIYQALQFDNANENIPDVEIIYGEFVKRDEISYVRNLSPYWELSETTQALNQFTVKLDGRKLSKKLQPYWAAGAMAVQKLSEIVALNYSLQITDVLQKIREALNSDLSETPEWVKNVRQELENIYKKLNKNTTSLCLLEYSKYLDSKALYTQSVIALQVCIETAVAEFCGKTKEEFGDYDWWQSEIGGKKYFYDLRKKMEITNKDAASSLYAIAGARNAVAHGGSKDKFTKKYPTVEYLRNVLKNGIPAVELFIKDFIK